MFAKNSKNKYAAEKQDDNTLLIGIDIGTAWLRIIAGTVAADGAVSVRYYREVPSSGMTAGAVSDLFSLGDGLTLLLQDVEASIGQPVTHCFVGIAGRHIASINEAGSATVQSKVVTPADQRRCMENACSVKLQEGYEIIQVVPQYYTCDGGTRITNPIGLSAMRVEVMAHIVSCSVDQESNLRRALSRVSSDVVIDRFVFTGIAASHAVLLPDDQAIGVGLIDYGAGTVNVAVYDESHLIMSFGLDRGGKDITRAIAMRFGLPLSLAEKIKCDYGAAGSTLLTESDRSMSFLQVPVRGADGREENIYIKKEELADIIGAELQNVFNSVSNFIERFSRETKLVLNLGAGFVLTGGVAKTRGIDKLASTALSPERYGAVKVKIGVPSDVTWCEPNKAVGPDLAVAVGLLSCHQADNPDPMQEEEPEGQERGLLGRWWQQMKDWYKTEM